MVPLSSNLLLMSRWNVHQRGDRIFAETIDSSFTLREKHSTSSSKLSCVSLLKHKDGTRTIEMILKSTVLISTVFSGLMRAALSTILVAQITCVVFLVEMDPEGSFKHCIAVGISRRLAGYWEKFSISNHHASVDLHWLW